jgi:hypothetical protein
MEKNNTPATTTQTMDDMARMSKAFAESGMFPDIATAAKALVKIQAGKEMGIAPFAAMTGIHMIVGRPVVGAGIIASKIKSSHKYDYAVVQHDDTMCSLDFFEGKKKLGNSAFTIADARKAGTKNIDKFPKNMLFARAISNGVKWFCPDVFDMSVYTEGEIDPLNEKIEDIRAEVVSTTVNESAIANGNGHTKTDTKLTQTQELQKKVYDEAHSYEATKATSIQQATPPPTPTFNFNTYDL